MKIDLDQIRSLIAVVAESDVTELTIEAQDEKITIKKAAPVHQIVEIPPTSRGALASSRQGADITDGSDKISFAPKGDVDDLAEASAPPANANLVPVISPMVGTFYRSPSPDDPAYVDVGDRISVGQTVCIIEAMKLMNDLPAEVAGRIVKICAENGSTVEYGQPLFLVDPKG